MQKKDCFLIGTIFKLHGYKGNVNIYNESNINFDLSIFSYVFIEIKNDLIPFFTKKIRITKPKVLLVTFNSIDSELEAKKLLKKNVYIPKEWIPESKKTVNLAKELIGYSIIDLKFGYLGVITYINTQTSQYVIFVETKNKKQFCFPMHSEFIKNTDRKQKIIKTNIPEELLNLN